MGIKAKGEQLYEKLYDTVRSYSAQRRRINEFKHKTGAKILSAEQVAEVKKFYAPYRIPNMVFHSFFTEKTGEFRVNYIPQDLYVGYIDPYFNDIRGARYLDNKCYYGALFHTIPQPYNVLRRVNGIWLTENGVPVSVEELTDIIQQEEDGVFVKEAETTAGGFGVTYIDKSEETSRNVLAVAETIPTDLLVQRRIQQHEELAKINVSSVNTLRIYSILGKDGKVTIYSSVLRMGVGNAKVDNYASGGFSCGITEDGKLRKYAYNKLGQKAVSHPTSGLVFEGFSIPSYDEAVKLVHKAHPLVPHYRSVSWDIAITKEGTPILIEANLCRGGIDLLQLNNGPLFGEDAVKLLDEVFGVKR